MSMVPGDAPADLPWFLRVVPQCRPDSIRRPRITALIDDHLAHSPLLLVAAPAGFGKTIALADWARSQPAVHWFSVISPATANDIAHAATTLVDRHVGDQVLTIVIDDAHRLDDAFTLAAAGAPALMSGRVRLVLIGHPQLLDRYRRPLAMRTADVLRAADLRLTPAEFTELTGVPPSDTPALDWPLAARLGVVARGPGSASAIRPTDDDLPDYVQHVLLPSLPAEVAEFILAATICPRLDRHVATALTDRPAAEEDLDWWHRNGLFLDAHTDGDGRIVYQWHELFARACQTVLTRTRPAQAADLRNRAAHALAEQFPADAIEHALQAGDSALAVQLIDRHWLALLLGGLTHTLEALCARLPTEHRTGPVATAVQACCRHVLGDEVGGELLHRHLPHDEHPTTTRAFAELILARDTAPKADALDTAQQLLRPSAPDYPYHLFVLAWSELRVRRAPGQAVALLSTAAAQARSHGLTSLADRAEANGAFALAFAGRFTAAESALATRTRLPTVDDWRYDDGLVGMSRTFVAFCRGELDDAQTRARQLISEIGTEASFAGLARIYYALATAARRDTASVNVARAALGAVSDTPQQGLPWPVYKHLAAAELDALAGDTARARERALSLREVTGAPVTQALLADLLRRLGDTVSARHVLGRLTATNQPDYVTAMAATTGAALAYSADDAESAHRLLAQALAISDGERTDYPFVAGDAIVGALLREHVRRGSPQTARIAHLLAARGPGPTDPAGLTPREREVLALLATSMTAGDIAAQLHVSVTTIRTHVRGIYRKLGVANRQAAVREAHLVNN